MTPKPISIIDQNANRVAPVDVVLCGDHYEGHISLASTPPHLKQLFEQFEEVVEGQMFSLLDGVIEKIEHARLRVVYEDGTEEEVSDLQVYPSRNHVTFKIRQPAPV